MVGGCTADRNVSTSSQISVLAFTLARSELNCSGRGCKPRPAKLRPAKFDYSCGGWRKAYPPYGLDCAYQLQETVIDAYQGYQFHLVYQKVHHFCAVDMGGFYLDIIKDRQYTTQKDSIARRSAQTAMYHIAEALERWLAPILSFTADEIWEHLCPKSRRGV